MTDHNAETRPVPQPRRALGWLGILLVGAAGGVGSMMALLAASVITLTAICSEGINTDDKFFGELLYGLLVTIITIIAIGALSRVEGNDDRGGARSRHCPR